jgi:hypothetical protein
LISLPLTVRFTAHLTQRRSRRLMILTYFREISHCTLSWWVRWASIRVLGYSVPNMRFLACRRTILLVCPPKCPRRKHRLTWDTNALAVKYDRETHTTRLSLEEYFVGIDVFFFSKNCCLYMYFVLFIYGLKFSFVIYVLALTSYKNF